MAIMNTAKSSGAENRTDPFYLSPRWKKIRKLVLVSAKYADQVRIRKGDMIEANTVHHIFPREQYPEYEWERWNLIAVSEETHKHLHKPDGSLSEAGKILQEEAAEKYGKPISKMILIVGMPGSGKTTRAKEILKGGICYDLDAIAGALRLRGPQEEKHIASRRMANNMLRYFIASARKFSGRVIVIRTAPTLDEVIEMDPDQVIVCSRKNTLRQKKLEKEMDIEAAEKRLAEIREWATAAGVELEDYPPRVTF